MLVFSVSIAFIVSAPIVSNCDDSSVQHMSKTVHGAMSKTFLSISNNPTVQCNLQMYVRLTGEKGSTKRFNKNKLNPNSLVPIILKWHALINSREPIDGLVDKASSFA